MATPNLRENMLEPRVQHHIVYSKSEEVLAHDGQKLSHLHYERDSLQAWLTTYDSRIEGSCESLRGSCERLETYRSASVSLLLRLEL